MENAKLSSRQSRRPGSKFVIDQGLKTQTKCRKLLHDEQQAVRDLEPDLEREHLRNAEPRRRKMSRQEALHRIETSKLQFSRSWEEMRTELREP
jgi:hypothetical protein